MPTTATRTTILRRPAAAANFATTRGLNAVSVVVTFALDGSGNATWAFDKPQIEMAAGTDTINFTLNTTTGCVFANYFYPASAHDARFTQVVDRTGTVLTVTDVNNLPVEEEAVEIQYCVAVTNPATGQTYYSDPVIVNDPPDPPLN